MALLRRSLLWHRAPEVGGLEEIDFKAKKSAPPSWSWMAYKGGIDYLELPFGQVEWEENEIVSPWSSSALGRWYSSDDFSGIVNFRILARSFWWHGKVTMEDAKIVPRTELNEQGSYSVELGWW